MADIGSTLREARMRERIDITEVEAQTKIRAKYLRAIENEEWDLLPGPVYAKSFLRTYGDYLGLDSRMLVDEFRRRYERPSEHDIRPGRLASRERERERQRRPRPADSAVGADRPRRRSGRAALYFLGQSTGRRRRRPPSARAGQLTTPSRPPSTDDATGCADHGHASAGADRTRVRLPRGRQRTRS